MKAPRLALAVLSLAALAACADGLTPTGTPPARAAYNSGGLGMGGGNVAPTDTTKDATITSTTTPTAPDSVGRGGLGMGGGN